jgi:hypothetical protein
MNASDRRTGMTLSDDARQAVRRTLDSLRQWNDEVAAANDRCLAKTLGEVASVQRAMGWPEHIGTAAREGISKASKLQTEAIEQLVDAWEQLLKGGRMPSMLPQGFDRAILEASKGQWATAIPGATPLAEMSLAPFKAWMQAMEMWQRQWVLALSSWDERSSGPTAKFRG